MQWPTGNKGNNKKKKKDVEKKDVEKKSDVKKKPKTIWLSNVKRT